MKKFLLLMIFIIIITGCTAASDCKAYISADEATYAAVASEYISALEFISTLPKVPDNLKMDKEKLERRKRLMETWKLRIDKAKEPPEEAVKK